MAANPELMSATRAAPPAGLGLDSERARYRMTERLMQGGIRDADVLDAMAAVPRHLFVEQGLASRAYEDVALPIGYEQTISKPSIVSHMLETVLQPIPVGDRRSARVLEIGTGCGYQTAILAHLFGDVVTVERIRSLHDLAERNLADLALPGRLRRIFGDGTLGLVNSAPFHAIVLAAALDSEVPEALLHHIRIGGRLIAPVSQNGRQRLHVVDRCSQSDWQLVELDAVRFVPMMGGTR
jgi:protein-L-isoaspartate(D-aspartate) O-methyltransferase